MNAAGVVRAMKAGTRKGKRVDSGLAENLRHKLTVVNDSRFWLTRLGVLSAHPAAFGMIALFAILWLVLDRQSLGWQGVASLATLCMTLFIQRAEHRDTQAIHAKLDELLRVSAGAHKDLARLDQQEPEVIERHREQARAGGVRSGTEDT